MLRLLQVLCLLDFLVLLEVLGLIEMLFNLENNIFQVVGVERFTPSLHHFPLDIWKPRGELPYEKAARNALRKI